MDQLFELVMKHGLRPLELFTEVTELERKVNRSELSALLVVHYYGEMTMSELAASLGVPLSTMTSLAKRLVHKGLIIRMQSGKDQRSYVIRLSAEGEQMALQIRGILNKLLERIQNELGEEELAQFISLAMKVIKALQQKEAASANETGKDQQRIIPIEE